MELENMILAILNDTTQALSVSSFYQALRERFNHEPSEQQLPSMLRQLYHDNKINRLSVRNDVTGSGFYVYYNLSVRTTNRENASLKKMTPLDVIEQWDLPYHLGVMVNAIHEDIGFEYAIEMLQRYRDTKHG